MNKVPKRLYQQQVFHWYSTSPFGYRFLLKFGRSSVIVSLGILNLELPYYYDAGIYFSMLFLSWAGRSLHQCLTPKNEARILDQVNMTLRELHGQQVLHKDVEPRNWLWDEQHFRLMLVDFERAEIRGRPPLGTPLPESQEECTREIEV